MVATLPRWVEYGAFILAAVAGSVNAIGLIGFGHQSISHLSGSATLLGIGFISPSYAQVVHLIGVLLSFMVGAALSGWVLSGQSLKLGRYYDVLLSIEAMLLAISMYFLNADLAWGHFSASAACGLQNALATTYSGAIVRTTHVTGIFTDLGIMLGAKLRGETFDKRKAILFLLIIIGFIVGGMLGAWLFSYWQFMALAMPAVICLMLAFAYRIYSRHLHTL